MWLSLTFKYFFLQGAGTKPKKTVKASDAASSSVSGGGLDGLPREDISSKIPPAFLKEFESSNWKVRILILLFY